MAGEPNRFINFHNRQRRGPDYTVASDSGCWIWHRIAVGQYGQIQMEDGRAVLAHRFYYEKRFGPISARLHLHHKCRETRCVNPDHLAPMTKAEHAKLHMLEDPLHLRRR